MWFSGNLPAQILAITILATGCTSGPARNTSPSQQDTPDFHAIGQEPGWLLDIYHQGRLVLEYAYGQKRLVVPTPAPQTTEYTGKTLYHVPEQELLVTISPDPCTDSMSGRQFNYTVTVTLNEKRFEGCGTRNPVQGQWSPPESRSG